MSKYAYVPEQGYVRLERITPAHHGGVAATGFLEDFYTITDENYIRQTWGGGTYKVYAYQPYQGYPSLTGEGYITIAGVPLALPGPGGTPVPFPESPAAASKYALAGTRQAIEAGAAAPVQGQVGGSLGMSDAGIFGILDRLQGNSDSRSTNELIEQLRQHYSADAERQAEIFREGSSQQKELHGQILAMQGAGQAPLQEALSNARQQTESLRNDYNERLRIGGEQHRHQLDQLQAANSEAIKLLQGEHDAATTAIREASSSAVATMREDRVREVDGLRESHRAETETFRREADRMRDGHQREISTFRETASVRERDIRDTSQRGLDETRNRLEERARTAEAGADRARTEHVAEISRMRDEFGGRDTAMRAESTERIEQLRRDLMEQHGTTNTATNKTYEAQITMLRDQLDQERQRSQDRVDNERNTSKSVYEPRVVMMAQQIEDLRSDLANTRAEAANASMRASEKSDPLQQLQQMSQLHSAVQGVFGGSQTAAQDPPGWLGKLATHGPAIAEHVIKPMLEPLTDAVQVARQESEQRRNFLQQREEARETGAVVAPVQQVPVHQQQIRPQVAPQPPPQPLPIHTVQDRESMFEPGPPVSLRPKASETETVKAVETMPDDAASDTGSSVNSAVLEYLNSAYSSGKAPAILVSELKSLQSLGVIDASDLEQITGASEEKVLNSLMAAAEAHGADNLTTPDGQMYLSNIYRELQQ